MNSFVSMVTIVALVVFAVPTATADCSLTSLGIAPLSDSAALLYKGVRGGLYPGGRSTRPFDHETSGVTIANAIVPLDASGNPAAQTGDLVMISLGMSNARTEFNRFVSDANADASTNSQLVIVNGAQDSRTADDWADVNSPVWSGVDSRLSSAGVTPAQVQIAWFKAAERRPAEFGEFPTHAEVLAANIEQIARNLKTHFPNVKLAYMSSRTRAYTTSQSPPQNLNPEPYAFESGFSVRWVIEEQLAGASDLNYDPQAGSVVAPHLNWGPYIWADGTHGRSDGMVWNCSDVIGSDFIHPSGSGNAKVSDMLLAFFKTDPTSVPWFLEPTTSGQPPSCSIEAVVDSESAPATVAFTGDSNDNDGNVVEHAWTFDDGTFSFEQHPDKIFHAADSYETRLTVTDDDGNPTTCTRLVTVPEPTRLALGLSALGTLGWLRRRRP